jgi:outer membrane receptor protein involved in Fe transport
VFLVRQDDEQFDVTLQPDSVYTRITVTATRGASDEAITSPHIAIVKDLDGIVQRPLPTLGNVLEQEPGIFVQQSSYAQVSPFLRGLTGYQVLNLVDGLRFNNSTFRSGPNQYLAFVEPSQASRVEALLGPTGVQYGSDSLGGAIHVITRQPRFSSGSTRETHGDVTFSGATADLSGAASAHLSGAGAKLFWLAGVSGRRHADLRAGEGGDSRNVYHRLFGMSRDQVRALTGNRLQDSGFSQYGVEGKLAVRFRPDQLVSVNYQRGAQDGVRGYKDLLGGLGRLQSTFEPQVLNWLYGRYEKLGLGPLDSLSGTVSLNSQTDGGSRQNLLYTDPITTDYARVNTYGYTAQAATHWGSRLLATFGGDYYDELIQSAREVRNPVTGAVSRPRPLYPNGSRYRSLGLFAQGSYDLTKAVRATAGVRFTGVRFAAPRDLAFGVPESAQWFQDVTFHSSLRYQIASAFGVHAVVSRGFRAPNLNDLGALGLNDLGYEIPAFEAVPAGALLSTDSGESASSKGTPLSPLLPESLMNYELGVRLTPGRLYLRAQMFDAELSHPIVRRTLLFPAGGAPAQLAGLPVTAIAQTAAQKAQGVVAVATALDPRAVKAFTNDGRSRYYGVETLARYAVTTRLSLEANYSYILGRDLDPNRNIRRLPPQAGAATARYALSGRRPWFEVSLAAAGAQDRFSGGDRDDERIGASFRRADIASFYRGSRVAPYLDPATGVFRPTGESLTRIQDRVLPIGSSVNGVTVMDNNTRVPLYLSTAGWATVNLRTGIPIGERWQAMAALENILDRNYRMHGSGVDAPGISAYVSLRFRF